MIDILGILIIVSLFSIITFFITSHDRPDLPLGIKMLFFALMLSMCIVILNNKLSNRKYIITEEKINIEDLNIKEYTNIKFSGNTDNIEIKKIIFDVKESSIFMDFDVYQIIIDSSILTIYPDIISDSTEKVINEVLKETK